mgnify:CR=1 FL=1
MVLKTIDISSFKISSKNRFFNLQNIIDEINIMILLNNTNISPKLIDTWIYYNIDNSLYICILMENKGISLSKWEQNNTFTDEDDRKIKEKIEELHKNNIIHTDLHRSNILVEEINNNRDFFIADFGLSKTLKQLINNLKEDDYIRYNQIFNKQLNIHKPFNTNTKSEYLKEILLLLDLKNYKDVDIFVTIFCNKSSFPFNISSIATIKDCVLLNLSTLYFLSISNNNK